MAAQRISDVRPEYVFLGFLVEKPVHGYQLYRIFKENLGFLWHISESQMYATLKRLDKRGWTAQENSENETGPVLGAPRHPIAITEKGLLAFNSWLDSASAISPRALRLEFLTRVYFSSRKGHTASLVNTQRQLLETELERIKNLASASAVSSSIESQRPSLNIQGLAFDFRVRQVQAALEWLDTLVFS